MPARILHILDSSTPPDAAESLAILIRHDLETHEVAVMGHRSTGRLLESAGLWREKNAVSISPLGLPPEDPGLGRSDSGMLGTVHWLPSLGWADPSGWRALRRLVRQVEPTYLHAWGLAGALAAAMAAPSLPRLVTLPGSPLATSAWMVRLIDRRNAHATKWVVRSPRMGRELMAMGLLEERIALIPPGVDVEPGGDRAFLRQALELSPDTGPVLLLGGEGAAVRGLTVKERARHDFGLWVGGILQELFPRIRILVREDLRGRQNHGLERLLNDLPDGEVPVIVPASFTWDEAVGAADVLMISADGPVSMGAVLHAMALGVPVVGMPVDALCDVITDGVNGLLAREVKPRALAARVEDLLADAGLRERIVAAARQDARERLSADAMVEGYRGIYEGAGVTSSISA